MPDSSRSRSATIPEIDRILTGLADMGYSISPASLRLDDLTEPIVRQLRASGEKTLTIAPETGSDRLRRVINKTVTNDEILDRAELIFASGIENLKLYYMIGLPTETDEDLVAIRDLTLQIRDIMLKHAKSRGHIGRIIASVNPLVPKPSTAYQWLPMEDPGVIDAKVQRLRELTSNIDNVFFNIKSERHSFYQALLSLGDRRVAPAIEAAEANGGDWRRAVADAGVDADFFVFRDRSKDAVLPWSIIDGGMKESFFRNELDKSLREEWTLAPEARRRKREAARDRAIGARAVGMRRSDRAIIDRPPRQCYSATASCSSCSAIRLQDQIAQPVLRRRIGNRPKQRETPPFAVDRILPRRKRDVPAVAVAPLPYREADQLQTLEVAVFEVNFGFGELARRSALVVRCDFHSHDELLCPEMRQRDTRRPPCAACVESADGEGVAFVQATSRETALAPRAAMTTTGAALPERSRVFASA